MLYFMLQPVSWINKTKCQKNFLKLYTVLLGGSVAECLACWTQAQKGLGSNRCRVTVLGKLFTPVVPQFNKQQNW